MSLCVWLSVHVCVSVCALVSLSLCVYVCVYIIIFFICGSVCVIYVFSVWLRSGVALLWGGLSSTAFTHRQPHPLIISAWHAKFATGCCLEKNHCEKIINADPIFRPYPSLYQVNVMHVASSAILSFCFMSRQLTQFAGRRKEKRSIPYPHFHV